MMPKLVGLGGYARTGKDTVASILVEHYGYTRVAFADCLRDFVVQANPLVPYWDGYVRLSEVVSRVGWEKAKESEEVRRTLQAFGMAGRRVLDADVWVEAAMKKLGWRRAVITDVRFPNEFDAIVKRGGVMVRVHRPGIGPVNGHASEVALDDHDFHAALVNNGTLVDLEREASDLLAALSTP